MLCRYSFPARTEGGRKGTDIVCVCLLHVCAYRGCVVWCTVCVHMSCVWHICVLCVHAMCVHRVYVAYMCTSWVCGWVSVYCVCVCAH